MTFVFPLATPSVAIAGSAERFPVRRIWCVGRNYAEHAREMGFSEREAPFFFAKPADAVVPGGGTVAMPPQSTDCQHEIELVVAIGKAGERIAAGDARSHIFGYAVGLDLTRRDLQRALRDKGRPWEMAKAFDQSAPIGPIHRLADTGVLERGEIWLKVNGAERQRGDIADLIWSVDEVIAQLSAYVSLAAGDLIFTGTPAGVGRLQAGDVVVGGIAGLGELQITLA
jgi:fumarylpyruvate hydrolase